MICTTDTVFCPLESVVDDRRESRGEGDVRGAGELVVARRGMSLEGGLGARSGGGELFKVTSLSDSRLGLASATGGSGSTTLLCVGSMSGGGTGIRMEDESESRVGWSCNSASVISGACPLVCSSAYPGLCIGASSEGEGAAGLASPSSEEADTSAEGGLYSLS